MHFESNCFIDFQSPIMCFTILDSRQAWCKQVQNPINVSRPCWKFKKVLTGLKLVYLFVFRILYFHFGIVRTPKNIKKVEMEKLLKDKGDPKKGRNSLGKRGMQLIWVFFLSGCGKCDYLTFNYTLVVVFFFPLNVGVSPRFHCSVLLPVYRMYTSCFHITVVSSCYRLHTFCLHLGVTSCFSMNMWF